MLRPFEIHEPGTVEEATRLLARFGDEAAVYAGGTELIPVMKDGLAHFRHLVNIKTIPGLDEIAFADGRLRIGALATHRQIERSPVVQSHAPALAQVASRVANLRVRNVGTLGGNLCFAEPHSDPAALLVACDATVVLARSGGERCLPVDQFILGILQTAREPDELLVRVELRPHAPGEGAAYRRFALHERPTAGVAAVIALKEGMVAWARIAAGSVGPVPSRAPEAEALLVRRRPEPSVLRAAADQVGRATEILEDLYGSIDYKRHIVAVLAAQALHEAAARAVGGN